MELTYFGHAAIGLRAATGERLVVDPYEPGGLRGAIRYRSIPWSPDYVLCTHSHDDHAAVDALPGAAPERIDGESGGPFEVGRCTFDHDEYGGERFGGAVEAVRIEADGAAVVHLSDVGQSPEGAVPELLLGADLACIPTGGFYTIGAAQAWEWARRLAPNAVVPIHYATAGCDLPLHGAESFLSYARTVSEPEETSLEIPRDGSGRSASVIHLRPTCLSSP